MALFIATMACYLVFAASAGATPSAMFAADADAQSGATNPTNIDVPAPHLSWINNNGAAIDRERMQVFEGLGLWRFDGNGTDQSPYGRAATLSGTGSWQTGLYGQALDATGSGTSGATLSDIDAPNGFTIDFWVRFDTCANEWDAFVFKGGASGNGNYWIDGNCGSDEACVGLHAGGSDPWVCNTGAGFNDMGWHHVAGTASNGTMRIYVDGVELSSGTYTGSIATNNQNVRVGFQPSGDQFDGRIDDLRIMDREVSQADLQALATGGQPHGSLLAWDSDPTDAGIPVASCANAARCADVVFGGAPSMLRAGSRYAVRQKYRAGAGAWGSWSTADWFEMSATYTPDVTISGTVMRDELGHVWDGCSIGTNNIRLRVEGRPPMLTSCHPTTGAFTFIGRVPALDRTIAIWIDGGSSRAVTYTMPASTTANITGLVLTQDRMRVRHEDPGSEITGPDTDALDDDYDSDIPWNAWWQGCSVAGELHVEAGMTWNPGCHSQAESFHLEAGASMTSGSLVEARGIGELGCEHGPGLMRPVCIEAGATWTGTWDFTFTGDGDKVIDTGIYYPSVRLSAGPAPSTITIGTGPGQHLQAGSLSMWDDGEAMTLDLDRWRPQVTIDGSVQVDGNSRIFSREDGSAITARQVYGNGTIDTPATDWTIDAASSMTLALGGWNWWDGWDSGNFWSVFMPRSFIVDDLTIGSSYVVEEWATNGSTPVFDSGGIDAPAAITTCGDGGTWEAGTAGVGVTGTWAINKWERDGSADGTFGTGGAVSYDPSASAGDQLTDIACYGWEDLFAVGRKDTNGGDWAVRSLSYDGTLNVDFSAASDDTGGLDDAATAVYPLGGDEVLVVGYETTAVGDSRWKVQQYNSMTGAILATEIWDGGPGADRATFIASPTGYNYTAYIGGRSSAGGGSWVVRTYDTQSRTWSNGFWPSGLGMATIDPTAGDDYPVAAVTDEVGVFVIGRDSTNGGDAVMRLLQTGTASFSTSFGSGGASTVAGGPGAQTPTSIHRDNDTLLAAVTVPGAGGSGGRLVAVDQDGIIDDEWAVGGIAWDTPGADTGGALGATSGTGTAGLLRLPGLGTGSGSDWQMSSFTSTGEPSDDASTGSTRFILPPNNSGFRVNGDLQVGRAGDSGRTDLDLDVNDSKLVVLGDVHVTSKGRFRASDDAQLSVGGSFEVDPGGTYVHNGGVLKLVDAERVARLSLPAGDTFNDLTSRTPGKRIELVAGATTTIDGAFTLDGGSCAEPIELGSDSPGLAASVDAASATVEYVQVTDSTAVVPLAATDSINGGNNTNWIITGACGPPAPRAPINQFSSDVNAQVGSLHGTIATSTPRFSWVQQSGVTFDRQRMQVMSDWVDEDVEGLWHFNGSGADDSGKGRIATNVGGATYQASRFTQALDATGAAGSGATIPSINLPGDATIDAWFRFESCANEWDTIVYKGNGTDAGNYGISANCATNEVCVGLHTTGSGSGNHSACGSPVDDLSDLDWHHVVMVIDAEQDGILLYVDGAYLDGQHYDGTVVTNVELVTVGYDLSGSELDGRIDELRIVSRALDGGEVQGYYNTRRPHNEVIWDSDPLGNGVALGANCLDGTRCADVVYGGGPGDLLAVEARYWARTRLMTPGSVWSRWSAPDWFETVPSISAGVVGATTVAMTGHGGLPEQNATGTIDVQVSTNSTNGYQLVAYSRSDAAGLTTGINDLPAWTAGPTTPAAWPATTYGYFGLSVLSATGGKDTARWGAGTTATSFGTLKYAGPVRTQTTMLHERTGYSAGTDTVSTAVRASASMATAPGLYTTTVVYTAIARP